MAYPSNVGCESAVTEIAGQTCCPVLVVGGLPLLAFAMVVLSCAGVYYLHAIPDLTSPAGSVISNIAPLLVVDLES